MADPCAPIKEAPPLGLKGAPVKMFDAPQPIARLSDIAVDCNGFNAVTVEVLAIGGTNPQATVTVKGSAERGGNYLQLSDPNSSQIITTSKSFDVVAGTRWVKIDLSSVSGFSGGNSGYIIWVTPYVSPGQARVNVRVFNGNTEVGRMGNLNGLLDYNSQAFGVAAGNDLSKSIAAFSGFAADDTNGLRLFNTPIALYNAGVQTVNIDAAGTNIWVGPSSADKRLAWNGSTLSITGTVTATVGAIGGWTIGATALTSGTGANTVGLDSGGTNPAIYAGSATPGSAPFRVTQAGVLTATNATITGVLTVNSNSSLAGVVNIGTSGGIFQGTGTFATPTTGLKIYNSGGVGLWELWGSGTKKVYADTTGQLIAGAGNVTLNSAGVTIANVNSTSTQTANATLHLGLTGTTSVNNADIYFGDTGGAFGILRLQSTTFNASSAVNGHYEILVYSSGTLGFTIWGAATGATLHQLFQVTDTGIAIGSNSGALAASAGIIRIPNGEWVKSLSANGLADINMIRVNSSNQLDLGTNNTIVADGTASIRLGTSPATTGVINFSNNVGVYWRNAGNSADVLGIKVDSSDYIQLGTRVGVSVSPSTDLDVNGGSRFRNGICFYSVTTPQAQGTVTGSRGGNAALASLLSILNAYGLIVDSSGA